MRLVIVSNRLPVTISKDLSGPEAKRSIGGLVTGIGSYLATIEKGQTCFDDYVWVGWPGGSIQQEEWPEAHGLIPVFLEKELVQQYYYGYCNKVLWPLFHYFPNYIEYDAGLWASYRQANEAFCEVLKAHLRPGDVVWIHDYHLVLLPGMLRKLFPSIAISFFLHIPFPTNDMFRFLARAEQKGILEGMLGADVIGFHTYGYSQNFLQCVLRVLKLDHDSHEIFYEGRRKKVDIFPMGIDYKGIREMARSEECLAARKKLCDDFAGYKLILSIDRLDYTKGILNRLMAYDQLLHRLPEWREKVVLMLIVAPSRREIDAYLKIKRSIDEWVGNINGSYGTSTWVPVIYQYKQFNLPELCALYGASHVGLVTPLCDGMNLIAKEFIAAHTDHKGVLVLSEMAGAINELDGAIAVNPNSIEEMVQALVQALCMNEATMMQRNERMHKRLSTYDVMKWADEALTTTRHYHNSKPGKAVHLDERNINDMLQNYSRARSALFLLDYDGTLVPLTNSSQAPQALLQKLSAGPKNEVVIVSGRNRETLTAWFYDSGISLSADLGAWVNGSGHWQLLQPFDKSWKAAIRPIVERYAARLPLSFVEEKECAIVWDYRLSDPELGRLRMNELTNELRLNTYEHLNALPGENSLIIRNTGSTKGDAAAYWLKKHHYDFILAIGDDDMDEELFKTLPGHAYSIRVGSAATGARFYTPDQSAVLQLLEQFIQPAAITS